MTKTEAIEKAASLGYTIVYIDEIDEVRLRSATISFDALNQPSEYCVVMRIGNDWFIEQKVSPFIL